ncbi:major facilitator superfamily domain-containing protein, partial [Clohesyomyces aquaticus]
GAFISNADSSLVLATHPVIASEFDALHDSSWLLTSFALAAAATQPLYGKLSDIYGRKALLLSAYILFGAGCGLGSAMWHAILGRVISGAGSAGMTALVSILITDLVPLRQVASWLSYVNVVATTGRSVGGPLGGWLADTVGWRWSFLGQAPLAAIAAIVVWWALPNLKPASSAKDELEHSKLARIDFLGATLMTVTILAFLFPLEIGGVKLPWSHPLISSLAGVGAVFGGLFAATEGWLAKEPILPLQLLQQRDTVLSFIAMALQSAAQLGLMFAVPLYFQITARASNTIAGAHLFPAVAGNAVGGVVSGLIIRQTGRYKLLILSATLIASLGYLLLILRWHGHTNWLESMYIVPGGFGTGVAQSAIFISIQAAVDPSLTAVATAALFLSTSVGMVAGMAGVSAVMQEMLSRGLDRRLDSLGFSGARKLKILERAISDVHYIDVAKPRVADAVTASYVEALSWTHGVSLGCSLVAFFFSLFLQQHKL